MTKGLLSQALNLDEVKFLNGIIGVFNTLLFVRQEGEKNGNKRWFEVLPRKSFRYV